MRRQAFLLALAFLSLTACENESYDSGDTALSYLRADFGMVHTAQAGTADYAVTDEGGRIGFTPMATVAWATTPDSLYRALIYYNKVENHAEPKAVQQVLVAHLLPPADVSRPSTDPLVFESAWLGGGFLNVGFAVKTGQDGSNALQSIGFRRDSAVTTRTETTVYITMLHAQNGVPEYYSSHGYVSVPTDSTCRYVLRVNTYDGWKEKKIGF